MLRIAIILFPGINTEYETRREINRAGMQGEFFRWNTPDAALKLRSYDGYVIGGGFAYEDRGRAGIIAALDPIMNVIKEETDRGKPMLGICNGAQILVEAGLIPGLDRNKLGMALARNKRMRGNEVLGTGYFNKWVFLKNVKTQKCNCMFTKNLEDGDIIKVPIAHAEGRFTTEIVGLMHELYAKNQIVFRYCDENGVIAENFPVNPNGAMFNAAGICNPAGNILAVMPHFERDFYASEKLFASMRDSIMERKAAGLKKRSHHLPAKPLKLFPLPKFEPAARKTVQMFVSLIITDNEAETHELTLKNLGFGKVVLERKTHFELEFSGRPDMEKLLRQLIQSGVLLNTNKESAMVRFKKEILEYDAKKQKFLPIQSTKNEENFAIYKLLVREKPDFIGLKKLSTIQNRLRLAEIKNCKTGVLWTIKIPTKSERIAEEIFKRIINTHLFFNPHRQTALLI